jgi:single-stranded DNA-binding protein
MQEIKGRITRDATIEEVSGKNVVRFDLEQDSGYYSKKKRVKNHIYYHCAYWSNTAIAKFLTKDQCVSVFGTLSVRSWIDKNGEAQTSLNFYVSHLDFNGVIVRAAQQGLTDVGADMDTANTNNDDLPF